jgi:chemosensory pili system protein ChpC
MNAVVESVRSLWVPLESTNLLVPNVAIAEVVSYQPLEMVEDGPDWLLGLLRWRDHELPVISMERLCGYNLPAGARGSRLSVLNSVSAEASLPFYAMVTAGIPRLFNADGDALGESIADARTLPDTVADCVQIGSEEALIPNLAVIQALVDKTWKRVTG